jgi:hypothetical protein
VTTIQPELLIPAQSSGDRRPTKVFLQIEVPEDVLRPEEIWPNGTPEHWTLADVVAELRLQYGGSLSLSRLSTEWCIGGAYGGATLRLRDDTGQTAEMELGS